MDVDRDGTFELGSFREMSAAAAVRGTDRVLDPPVLSGAFRTLNAAGCVSRSGYLFRMWLRTEDGVWVPSDPPPDGAVAEGAFLCLAWPATFGTSGERTMVLDASGTLLWTREPLYSGSSAPSPLAPPRIGDVLVPGTGADGNVWTPY